MITGEDGSSFSPCPQSRQHQAPAGAPPEAREQMTRRVVAAASRDWRDAIEGALEGAPPQVREQIRRVVAEASPGAEAMHCGESPGGIQSEASWKVGDDDEETNGACNSRGRTMPTLPSPQSKDSALDPLARRGTDSASGTDEPDTLANKPLFFSQEGNLAEKIFVLFDDPNKTVASRIVAIVVMSTILLSTIAFVLETVPELRDENPNCDLAALDTVDCEPVSRPEFATMELVSIIIFTIDYLARILTVGFVEDAATAGVKGNKKGWRLAASYALQPLNIVDFVAIVPFYIELALGGGGGETAIIRVLRLARVLRIFKMEKHATSIRMVTQVIAMSTPALIILAFFSLLLAILCGSLITFAEGSRYSVDLDPAEYPHGVFVRVGFDGHSDEPSPFVSIPSSFWWVFVTATTVGYGDIYPTTGAGKVIGVVLFYTGIILIALPITILGMNFEILYRQHEEEEQEDQPKREREEKRRSELLERARLEALRGMQKTPVWPVRKPGEGWRQTVFHTLEDASSCVLAKVISILVMLAIIVSTCSFVMESMPRFTDIPQECLAGTITVDACTPEPVGAFYTIEVCCIAIFTVEYALRMICVHSVSYEDAGLKKDRGPGLNTLFYAFRPLNVIDFVAIAPFYIGLVVGSGGGLAVLRVLRLARVFRIFKMGNYASCAAMMVDAVLGSARALGILLFLSTLACVLFASCIYFAEGTDYSVDPMWTNALDGGEYPRGVYVRPSVDGRSVEVSPFRSIPTGFWWFFTTVTTVGYGDYYPTTTAGKCVGVITLYIGIILLALPITIIGGNFSVLYKRWEKDNELIKEVQQSVRACQTPADLPNSSKHEIESPESIVL